MALATKKRQRRDRVEVSTYYLSGDYLDKLPEEVTVTEEKSDSVEVLCPPPEETREDWTDFLYFMSDFSTAREMVDIVTEPWHWTREYAEYLMLGGVDR